MAKKKRTRPKFKTVEGVIHGHCPRCGEKKNLAFFEQKKYTLGKTNFKIILCQTCLGEWRKELEVKENKSEVDNLIIDLFDYMTDWDIDNK